MSAAVSPGTPGGAERLAAIAAAEYARRLATANRKVAAGEIPRDRAEAEMRAWAAIAVLAGAPGFEAELEEYRRTIVHYPGNGAPAVYGYRRPEAEARCNLARDLCGPNTWGPILSRARDAAIARATTPDTHARADALRILARALDVPLTAASCALATGIERKAA